MYSRQHSGVLNGNKSLRNTNINKRSQGRSLLPGCGTFSTSKVGGWQLAIGGWWQLAVGGSWRLAVGGGWPLTVGGWWRLAVGGWWSLGVVLKGGP